MSEFTFRELDTAHKKSFQNEPRVHIANDCACFQCLEHFGPSEIDEWAEDKLHRTAICPKCGIDSVLTEETLLRVPDDLLKAMRNEYFGAMNENAKKVVFDSVESAYEIFDKETPIRLFEADLILADRAAKSKL